MYSASLLLVIKFILFKLMNTSVLGNATLYNVLYLNSKYILKVRPSVSDQFYQSH